MKSEQKKNLYCSRTIQPSILYYGTPVLLLTTRNRDGTSNISSLSSSWALGDVIVLGLETSGKAWENLVIHPECVINLPDASLWKQVVRLASLTGKNPIPPSKQKMGFRFEKDKFSAAGLTEIPSELVSPGRIDECPLQIEAKVVHTRVPVYDATFAIVEAKAVRVHAHERIILGERHINPVSWNPLIYNFRHYFGLGEELGKTFRAQT